MFWSDQAGAGFCDIGRFFRQRDATFMDRYSNRKLVGLPVLVACASMAVWIASPGKAAPDLHRQGRQFTLYQTLSRNVDPVVVLGDSIVEGSTLPVAICGRAIVNAGLNGASTASDPGNWLAEALDGKRAAAIVVALGVNDAMASGVQGKEAFAARYAALLDQLSKLTSKLAVLQIAPVEVKGGMTVKLRDELTQAVTVYNETLRAVAVSKGVPFVALPAMTAPYTVDGLHLNANGYLAWDRAVMQAAEAACG